MNLYPYICSTIRGRGSPILLAICVMEDIEKYINKELNTLLDNSLYYLVEMAFQPNKKIEIFVDGPEGIDLEKCSKITRHLLSKIDEESGYERNFIIEVSSPGLDRPFNDLRQYKKNIGRKIEVEFLDGLKKEFKLTAISGNELELIEQVIKGNRKWKQDGKTFHFNIEKIKNSTVLVSF